MFLVYERVFRFLFVLHINKPAAQIHSNNTSSSECQENTYTTLHHSTQMKQSDDISQTTGCYSSYWTAASCYLIDNVSVNESNCWLNLLAIIFVDNK